MADDVVILGADAKPLPVPVRKAAQMQAQSNSLRHQLRVRGGGYRGAGHDHASTEKWYSPRRSTASAQSFDRDRIAERVRDMARNDPGIAAGIEKKVNNVIGTGWRLASKPNYRRLNITPEQADAVADQIEALWTDYAEGAGFWCDAARDGDVNDLLLTTACHQVLDDEAFGLVVWRNDAAPNGFQTAMQLIHPARCSNPKGRSNDTFLRDGISLDGMGASTGFYFRRAVPGTDGTNPADHLRWDWFPREMESGRARVVHVKSVREAGLKRSISRLASVMIRARQGDQYMDYETQAAMLNAIMALFIETPLDALGDIDGQGLSPDAVDSVAETNSAYHHELPVDMDGAQINVLAPGEVGKLTVPGHPNDSFAPFIKKIEQTAATVLGLTYEQYSGDWAGPNYAAMRAAVIEVARGFKVDAGVIRKKFLMPWYCAVVEEMFDKGMVVVPDGAPSFEDARDAWCRADWIGAAKGYIDPVKEVQAAAMRIAKGLSTYEIECGEQGHDYKVIIAQRVKEIREMLDGGLPEHVVFSIYGSAATEQAEPVESGDDRDSEEDRQSNGGSSGRSASGVPLITRKVA